MKNLNGTMIAIGGIGLFIGSLVGFLVRPSAFLVGQLPFLHVITGGVLLRGADRLFASTAQQSFAIMLGGAVIGTTCGLVIGYLVGKKKTS